MKRLVIWLLSLLLGSMLVACSGKTTLQYRIWGTAEEVNIHFLNDLGETKDLTVKPPFNLEFKVSHSFSFLIYVTNVSGQGEAICEVLAGDQSLGAAVGNTFAGCEGDYEKQGGSAAVHFTGYDDVFPEGYDAPAVKLPEGLNGMILFAGDEKEAGRRDFYVLNLDAGGELIQLTEGLGRSSSCPQLAPDGKQLAFVYGGSVFDLFVLNMDGTDLANLTNDGKDSLEEFCADWSPDGSQIIFTAGKKGSDDWFYQVYSARMDGSGIVQLTANTIENDRYRNPVWSPDGQKIAFISNTFGHEVYVMNGDGSEQTFFGDVEDLVKDFHWSPDGSKIVFACHGGLDNIGEGVCIMNNDGSGLIKVNDESLEGIYHTAWSPDGTKIAFAARNEGTTDIYVLNPDGTGLIQITHLQGLIPYWLSWISVTDLPDAPIPVSFGK